MIETTHTPLNKIDYEWTSICGRHKIVGYLSHDEEGCNPMDGDGIGVIQTDEYAIDRMFELDIYYEQAVRLTGTDLFEEEATTQDDTIALQFWEAARNRGGISGSEYAVALCQRAYNGYDTDYDIEPKQSHKAHAVWLPDKCYLDHINSIPEAERVERWKSDVESIINEYNRYCDGENYGVVVEYFTAQSFEAGQFTDFVLTDSDACWGFIGENYAKEELKSQFDHAVKRFFKDRKQLELFPEMQAAA